MKMPSHEVQAHLSAIRRQEAQNFARAVRLDLEANIERLLRQAETEEQRKDMRRLWDLMNDICAKHQRRADRLKAPSHPEGGGS